MLNHKITSIYEFVEALKQAKKENKVQFNCILGYKGFEGNEKLEELVKKEAADFQREEDPKSSCKINC